MRWRKKKRRGNKKRVCVCVWGGIERGASQWGESRVNKTEEERGVGTEGYKIWMLKYFPEFQRLFMLQHLKTITDRVPWNLSLAQMNCGHVCFSPFPSLVAHTELSGRPVPARIPCGWAGQWALSYAWESGPWRQGNSLASFCAFSSDIAPSRPA